MNIEETRKFIYQRADYRCENCGVFVPYDDFQIAHRIKQDKSPQGRGSVKYIIEFLKNEFQQDITKTKARELLHDPDNLRVTCGSYCNDMFNIFYHPVKRDALLVSLLKKHGITK